MSGADPLLGPDTAPLAPFVESGVLDAAAVHVAGLIGRAAGPVVPDVLLGAALAARAPNFGHVCVDLSNVASSVIVGEGALDARQIAALPWPDPTSWAAGLTASTAVRSSGGAMDAGPGDAVGSANLPLVWDGARLYLERYWRFEQQVAIDLLRRARAAGGLTEPSPAIELVLDDLFPRDDSGEPDHQREATRLALTRRLAVVAGGPGTGKTRTIARLIAAVQRIAQDQERVLEVALAAPTGKAAARMTEAVRAASAEMGHGASIANQDGSEARTLHRLLGVKPGGGFRHDRANPLSFDLVVVDESSMVSLPLMARLLNAMRPEATLVLVGDPYQLASVEAGAVLGEIVGTTGPSTTTAAGAAGPLAGNIVQLDRRHRFGTDSAIASLADAIRTGDAEGAVTLLRQSQGDQVSWVDGEDERGIRLLQREAAEVAVKVLRAARTGDIETGLDLAKSVKVLCATRLGSLGSFRWSNDIESVASQLEPGSGIGRRWYIGRPVIVKSNDYFNRLFNGDVGLAVAGPDGPVVAFEGPDGYRGLGTSQLGDVDTWWAMTIHKSQGSEFSRVIVALPPPPSPVLTRELLYTAVTRATTQVTLVATELSLRTAIGCPAARVSGLGSALSSEALT